MLTDLDSNVGIEWICKQAFYVELYFISSNKLNVQLMFLQDKYKSVQVSCLDIVFLLHVRDQNDLTNTE